MGTRCLTRTALVLSAALLAGLGAAVPARAQQTFGTTVYFDWSALLTDAGPKTFDTGSSYKSNFFAFRRAYFTYENRWGDIRFRFRYDADNTGNLTAATLSGNTISTSKDDKLRPFIKHIYFQHDNLFLKNTSFRIGMTETLTFKPAEDRWGFRSVAKTLMDGYRDVTGKNIDATSADLGASWAHGISKYAKYAVQVSNGSHYSHAETDKYKKYMGQLTLVPMAGLSFVGYVDYEQQAAATGAPKAYTYKGDVLFEMVKNLTAGFEYFTYANDLYLQSGTHYDVQGWSLFGRYTFTPDNLAAFARYDSYEPNTERAGDEIGLIIAGFDWVPFGNKALRLQPNVFIYSYKDATVYRSDAAKDSDVVFNLTFFMSF